MNKVQLPIEVKKADDGGNFSGWASTFGNVDLGNDVIAKDATVTAKTGQNGRIKLFLYHDYQKPVGTAEFKVSSDGIWVDGKINTSVTYAKDAYELMKDGALDEMSIGFNTTDYHTEKRDGADVRVIKSLELWEASIVPYGMNPQAQIQSVKSIRDFEAQLRSLGYSQKDAKTIASKGFNAIQRDVEKSTAEMVAKLDETAVLHSLQALSEKHKA
ncbi:MAG: HK97 family phage prohead protease [Pseudomonadota bacterium]|nr:HK97 family phage prohead protease [Pseudomonadota bacterium]